MKEIQRCIKCDQFTLEHVCSTCNQRTESVRPGKYSEHDKYAKYRRASLELERKERGLL